MNGPEDQLIPLSDAANYAGVTPEHLNLLSRQGKVKAEKVGRNWFTTKRSVDQYFKGIPDVSDIRLEMRKLEMDEKLELERIKAQIELRRIEKEEKIGLARVTNFESQIPVQQTHSIPLAPIQPIEPKFKLPAFQFPSLAQAGAALGMVLIIAVAAKYPDELTRAGKLVLGNMQRIPKQIALSLPHPSFESLNTNSLIENLKEKIENYSQKVTHLAQRTEKAKIELPDLKLPQINLPKIKLPKLSFKLPHFSFGSNSGGARVAITPSPASAIPKQQEQDRKSVV